MHSTMLACTFTPSNLHVACLVLCQHVLAPTSNLHVALLVLCQHVLAPPSNLHVACIVLCQHLLAPPSNLHVAWLVLCQHALHLPIFFISHILQVRIWLISCHHTSIPPTKQPIHDYDHYYDVMSGNRNCKGKFINGMH